MLFALAKAHSRRLFAAYALSTAGNVVGQLYPIATGLAINGVIEGNYSAVGWLIGCHMTALVLDVSGKMLDTRVFARIYGDMATSLVVRSHAEGIDPSIIAARSSLSREYVAFLERDVPAAMFAVVGLVVSLTALFWLDVAVGAACLVLFAPLLAINRWLARRSLALNAGLNDRLEHEVRVLREGRATTVRRHFTALGAWRVRLSDAEAKAFGAMELSVVALFAVALWRLAEGDMSRAGDIYATFSYVWKFVLSLDQVPLLVQQIAKLKDIGKRLQSVP
jgi:hypothetical protein